jgi:hypothetical protein
VRDFALAYFRAGEAALAVEQVLPLLDAEDEPVRWRAAAIVVPYGAAAVSAGKCPLGAPRAGARSSRPAVRTGAAPAPLRLMATDDLDNRAACDALVAVVAGLDDKERADLFAVPRTSRRRQRAPHPPRRRRRCSALGDARARKPLFALLGPREPHVAPTPRRAGAMPAR